MPLVMSTSRAGTLLNGGVRGSQLLSSALIAAHLAPTDGSTYPHFDRDDFALLLEESLGSDEDGQPNLGNDVNINHKLICVIIKAGLNTIDLRSDDPFRECDEDLGQIRKCIEVIRLAVEKSPEALFVLSKSEDLGSKAENVPLFVWIIPKLLSLLVLDKYGSQLIADCVWSLLDKILVSEKQCSNISDLCISISTYFEDLLEGSVHEDHTRRL